MINTQQISEKDFESLLNTKKIINNYALSLEKDGNAEKLREYVNNLDENEYDPLVLFKQNIGTASKVIDVLLIIKKANTLKLN